MYTFGVLCISIFDHIMKVMTFTECGGSVRPCLHVSTVEAESSGFIHREYVNLIETENFFVSTKKGGLIFIFDERR